MGVAWTASHRRSTTRKRAPVMENRNPTADSTDMLASMVESPIQPTPPDYKSKPMLKWAGFEGPFSYSHDVCPLARVDARSARNPDSPDSASRPSRAKLAKRSGHVGI